MIDKKAIEQFVEKELDGTQYFLVGVNVTGANEIKIDIDSFESVDIVVCVSVTRSMEELLPREQVDY